MTTINLILLVMEVLSFLAVLVLCYKYVKLQTRKENEHYTDYKNGNFTMRVYKPEFEYAAIGNISRDKLHDVGDLNIYYKWALIEA